jgi:hypothetical protein
MAYKYIGDGPHNGEVVDKVHLVKEEFPDDYREAFDHGWDRFVEWWDFSRWCGVEAQFVKVFEQTDDPVGPVRRRPEEPAGPKPKGWIYQREKMSADHGGLRIRQS